LAIKPEVAKIGTNHKRR